MPYLPIRHCVMLASLAVMISPVAVAHDHGMSMDMPMHSATADSFGAAADASEATRTISIVMGDLSFSPDAVQVRTGDVIRFVVKNTSAADHDFTLGDGSAQAAHRAEMAKTMATGHDMRHHSGGNAIAIKAGETQELIWRFTRPATLEYGCNVPGHYEAGMKGVITVSP